MRHRAGTILHRDHLPRAVRSRDPHNLTAPHVAVEKVALGIAAGTVGKAEAKTDPNTQVSEVIGSGPFVFVKDEWVPGNKVVYRKFDK